MPDPILYAKGQLVDLFSSPYRLWPRWDRIDISMSYEDTYTPSGYPWEEYRSWRVTGGGLFLRNDNSIGNWDCGRSNGCGGAEIYEHSAYIGEAPAPGVVPDHTHPHFIGFPPQDAQVVGYQPFSIGASRVALRLIPVQAPPNPADPSLPEYYLSQADFMEPMSFSPDLDTRHFLHVLGSPFPAPHFANLADFGPEEYRTATEYGDPYGPNGEYQNEFIHEFQNWTPSTVALKDFGSLDVEMTSWKRLTINQHWFGRPPDNPDAPDTYHAWQEVFYEEGKIHVKVSDTL